MADAVVIYGFFLEPKRDAPWFYPGVDFDKWWEENTAGLEHEISTRSIPFMENHILYTMVFVGICESMRELGLKLDPEPLSFPEDYDPWDKTLLEFATRAGFEDIRIHEHSEEDEAQPYTIRWWACASPL
jgi:hypothetical protein